MMTEDNEASNSVPEFLTGQIPSRTALNQSIDHNDFLDTTSPLPEQNTPVAVQDPINRQADVLANLQNRPAAPPPFTIRLVNTTTLTFDGKREKIELFEDLFKTMIKMQPELSEQMKIKHFLSPLRK